MIGRVAQGRRDPRPSTSTRHLLDHVPSVVVGAGLFAVALAAYWLPGSTRFYDHFVWQAAAFLDGRAQIAWPVPASGTSYGNAYFQDVLPWPGPHGEATGYALLPFPPLPAIVLMPFVALWGLATDERVVSVALGAIDVALCWWALGGVRVSRSIRLAVTVFFAFGTVFWYAAQLGTTWFFAHVVAATPLLLAVGIALRADPTAAEDEPEAPAASDLLRRGLDALREQGVGLDGRQLLAGFLFGLACTARLTIVFGAPFFVLVGSGGSWTRRGLSAGLGAAVPVLGLLAYNLATAGHLFHPGYEYLYQREARGYPALDYNASWGIEDIRYLPQNLAIMLASLPALFPDHVPRSVGELTPLCQGADAVRSLFDRACPIAMPRDVGTSILLTSPAYLLALPALDGIRRNRLVAGGAIAVVLIAVVNLMHFSQGWVQFGYRFSNDFVVFALPVVALGLRRRGGVGVLAVVLIAFSVAMETWGVIWGNILGW